MNIAFIDRDGTLIFEPNDGIVRPQDFRILPGVTDSLSALQANGYTLVMVTNQNLLRSPSNKKHFDRTQKMLIDALKQEAISLDKIFFCPHIPEDECPCRKPRTGMVDAFIRTIDMDMKTSFVIGDRDEADGGLARAIGIAYVPHRPNAPFPSFEHIISIIPRNDV